MRYAVSTMLLIAATLVLILIATVTQAQSCGPRSVVVPSLQERYGETRRSVALDAQGNMIEMFASDDTGSWTLTATRPDGVTCLVGSGRAYETVAPEAEGDDL